MAIATFAYWLRREKENDYFQVMQVKDPSPFYFSFMSMFVRNSKADSQRTSYAVNKTTTNPQREHFYGVTFNS